MNVLDKLQYFNLYVQLLISMCIFSILVLTSKSYSSLHNSSYDQLLSKFSSSKVNMVEKNCIFLIFNGILVVIIRASGIIRNIAPVETAKTNKDLVGEDQRLGFDEGDKNLVVVKDQLSRFDDEDKAIIVKKVEDCKLGSDTDEEEEKKEEKEEEGLDELHMKCEDFIRKMRQEICG